MRYERLQPDPGPVEAAQVLDELRLGERAPTERPLVAVNFVASVDGRATVGGRSGPLGDESDRELFHGLRERVDAILAGTGTLRAERYGRLIRDPEARSRREAAGLAPEPLACIVTRTGHVPWDIPLFDEPAARVLIFSAAEVRAPACAAQLQLIRLDPGQTTLTTVLRRLRAEHDVRALLCEGGPTLHGALLHEGLVDELFLSVAPKLAGGGTAPTIASGPALPEPLELQLRWVLQRAGTLFLRYALPGSVPASAWRAG